MKTFVSLDSIYVDRFDAISNMLGIGRSRGKKKKKICWAAGDTAIEGSRNQDKSGSLKKEEND